MPACAISVLSTVLNKTCSRVDSTWALQFHTISKAMRIYALGDVLVGHLG